jgi:hypothetical protein
MCLLSGSIFVPKKSTGGILVGSNSDKFLATLISTLDFSASVMLQIKRQVLARN